nr:hypothetical protein BaRGS_009182 [Batillaria attramentaria]
MQLHSPFALEMIQNAEDAGASTVKILADARHFHQQFDQQTLRQYPHLKYLKGPALCVYNDEVFSDNDWKGIRMLHLSIKEKDPLKVGRFGLGFKSVFHLTDRVVIMSGDYVLYMDPFKNETRYCTRKRIAGRKGKELESILFCMGEIPTGASPMLLFLNNVESIDLYSKDESLGIKKLFTVDTAEAVVKVYSLSSENLVQLPEHVQAGLEEQKLLEHASTVNTRRNELGAREITLVEIVSKMLGVFNSGNSRYTANDVTTFMAYFLDNRSLIEDSSLLSAAKQVKFVPTVSGQFKAASELYSPSEILMDLFRTEDKFPCAEISKTDLLDKLKILGLRDESTLKSADLVGAAQRIEELQKSGDTQTAVKKAEGLWKLLVRYGETLLNNDATVLSTIATIHCLPRLQKHEMPVEYPSALPLCSRPVLVPPADMGDYSRLRLLGAWLNELENGAPQNADDAGATEIRFIKNFRHFGVNRIPEGWEKLQGPRLSVCTTTVPSPARTWREYHNLGRASKGSDLLKTGQYGQLTSGELQLEYAAQKIYDDISSQKMVQYKDSLKVWRSVAEEIYRQLAKRELPLFPVVRTDLGVVEWAPAVKRNGQAGLFSNTLPFFQKVAGSTQQTKDMSDKFQLVLKALGMKVLDSTPFQILDNFRESGVENVGEVSPTTVMKFLKSGKSGHGDGCNVGSAELFVHQQIFTIFQPFQSEKWQGMLQELNIPLLARMLPYSIAPEQYKTGQPCALAPRQKWLRGLWKFLETQLQTLKEEEGIANRQMIEEEIQCLSDWSLIPVKKKVQGVDKLLLYPVKDMHCVVYLPKKRDEFHPQLWEDLAPAALCPFAGVCLSFPPPVLPRR